MLEYDELCTFVTKQTKTRWIWLAMDRLTRKIIGCFIRRRDGFGAFGLWQSLPAPYLEAKCHTDDLAVSEVSFLERCTSLGASNTLNVSTRH